MAVAAAVAVTGILGGGATTIAMCEHVRDPKTYTCKHDEDVVEIQKDSMTSFAKTVDLRMDKHRPQFHFSPKRHWMNDPNGMVYYDGEYHLFYQYYPGDKNTSTQIGDDNYPGPIHWGHAISTDLVHWKDLPIALSPDEKGYIFSGSAVVDWKNTSGFGKDNQPPLVAIFTYHDKVKEEAGVKDDFETQGLAFSNDNGRNWIKFEENPVIKNPGVRDFRDPKVFWHTGSAKWVMVLAVNDHLKFYGSPDLRKWELLSEFGKGKGSHDGVWECPDLFPLKDEHGKEHWVLLESMNPGNPNGGSGLQYFIGHFDGKHFTLNDNFDKLLARQGSVWLDAGADNFAGVTWSDIPEEDGRRIFIGWMSNGAYSLVVPTEAWRGTMTIPWTLELHTADGVPLLNGSPVAEFNKLHTGEDLPISSVAATNLPATALADISMQFDVTKGKNPGFKISNGKGEFIHFFYNTMDGQLNFDRGQSGAIAFSKDFPRLHKKRRTSKAPVMSVRVILDISSIEIFVDGGQDVFTELFFPTELYSKLEVTSEGDGEVLLEGKMKAVKRIWGE
jgi:fructan beta-fructosidase